MRTILRNNYEPKIGDYHNVIVDDQAQHQSWMFDCDGVYVGLFHRDFKVQNEAGESKSDPVSQAYVTEQFNEVNERLDNIDQTANFDVHLDETGDLALSVTDGETTTSTPFREADDTHNGLMSPETYKQVQDNKQSIEDTAADLKVEQSTREEQDRELDEKITGAKGEIAQEKSDRELKDTELEDKITAETTERKQTFSELEEKINHAQEQLDDIKEFTDPEWEALGFEDKLS